MADSRNIKYNIKRLRRVKTWQLFALLLLAGFIAATFLRLNNIGMVERRNAVLSADKAGNPSVTQNRLYDLQRYVSTHMNANMGSLYLENQYKRDSQKAIDVASNDGNPNGNVTKKAQEVCAPRYAHLGNYSQAYEQCMLSEINKDGPAADPATIVVLPKADEYRHSYASPLWTPDFAGLSVLACVVIILIIVGRLVSLGLLSLILKMRNRDA